MPAIPDRLQSALADRYRLLEEAGRGGMATVYLAVDLKHGRQVAIKVLRETLVPDGPDGVRFTREIRIAAQLNHPQILPLHDSGTREGFHYYVMPYMGCETLRERIRREGRLPVDEAIRIASLVAPALDYAHRQGIVHRDIKPENILLRENQPVVADFGIARAVLETAADSITAQGVALGTAAYMSPEQAAGDPVDGRSDQYALAAVLYEVLTGRPPFVAATFRATLAQHLAGTVVPPRTIRATIPPAVESALLKALAKDPDRRFATMADFHAALTSPLVTSTAGAGATAAAIAVLPFVNASGDPAHDYLADGITDELVGALARVPHLSVSSRAALAAARERFPDPRDWGRELGIQTALEGTVRQAGNRIRVSAQLTGIADGRVHWSDRYDRETGDLFALQDDLAQRIVAALRLNLGPGFGPTPRGYTANLEAYHLYLRGRHAWNQRTPTGTAEAVRFFEAAIEKDPNYAQAYAGLADAYALNVDYRGTPVAEGLERARREAERALALDESLAEAHTSLGWVNFVYDWSWEKADAAFRRAVELDPGYATARQWYAWLLLALGRIDEALAEARLATTLDPSSVSIRRSLGWLHYYARQFEQALPHLHAALAMNPTLEETNYILGITYLQAGDFGAAEASFQAALTQAPAYLRATAALGWLAARQGDRAEAERVLALLGDASKTRYVSPIDFVILSLAIGHHDTAFEWLDRAYADRRGWMAYLRVEPVLDPVRGDPRFAALLKRMRLD